MKQPEDFPKRTAIAWSALCFLVFCAKAWEVHRWESPLRELLWNQKIMEPLVSGWFGLSWDAWTFEGRVDPFLDPAHAVMVFALLAGASACALPFEMKSRPWLILPAACLMLCLNLFPGQSGRPSLLVAAANGFLIWTPFAAACPRLHHCRPWIAGSALTATLIVQGVLNLEFMPPEISILFSKAMGFMAVTAAVGLWIPRLNKASRMVASAWGVGALITHLVSNFDPAFPGYWAQTWLHPLAFCLPTAAAALLLSERGFHP